MLELPVSLGEVVAGKYRVDRIIGAGGKGVVVAAKHLSLDEPVALKFLLTGASTQPQDGLDRFMREARAAAKIKNEHVARVIDVATLESGVPYIVMEYLDGVDLLHVVDRGHALSTEEALYYVLQICEALAEAHAIGIIHRDIKPANIFLAQRADQTNLVKVLDFGLSKFIEDQQKSSETNLEVTDGGKIMGSPLYMSPEQMRCTRDVDHRTDIWSLGVVLFELVTRHTPFIGDSVSVLAASVLRDPPRSLCKLRPDAPPALEKIVNRCLEKNPSRRYQNVADLAVDLLPFVSSTAARACAERAVTVLQHSGAILERNAIAPPSLSSVSRTASTEDLVRDAAETTKDTWLFRSLLGATGLALLGAITWVMTIGSTTTQRPGRAKGPDNLASVAISAPSQSKPSPLDSVAHKSSSVDSSSASSTTLRMELGADGGALSGLDAAAPGLSGSSRAVLKKFPQSPKPASTGTPDLGF